jgi:hypothetical protein
MDMIKITGLWKHKTNSGETYLSGSLSGITQLMVMPNKLKRNEKDPDYLLHICECKKNGSKLSSDDL